MRLRKKRKAISIPLSAMGDIAFLLLVFYMATTMVTDQKPRELPLPEVAAPVRASPYPLVIYADRKTASRESVYFFNEFVPLNLLANRVRERAALAPARLRVYLNIEKDLPYRFLNQVVEVLKEVGIRRMVITTRTPESAPPPPSR